MKKTYALLVVSFGTFYEDTRKKTIEAIEADLMSSFPERAFYRAWTSRMLISRMKKECDIEIDTVGGALKKMAENGIKDVLIQPTLLLEGQEFNNKILREIQENRSLFERVQIGKPLLATPEDRQKVAGILPSLRPEIGKNDMFVFMGHGSPGEERPPVNICYDEMNIHLQNSGFSNYTIGLVEAYPGIDAIKERLLQCRPEHVYLAPLMIVAGDHALNDMSGEADDSWKSVLTAEGFQVTAILKGLGEYPEIRSVFVDHAQHAAVI